MNLLHKHITHGNLKKLRNAGYSVVLEHKRTRESDITSLHNNIVDPNSLRLYKISSSSHSQLYTLDAKKISLHFYLHILHFWIPHTLHTPPPKTIKLIYSLPLLLLLV